MLPILLCYTLSTLMFSFFFYCYGHHRDLHSFPTRRSSDLRGLIGALEVRGGRLVRGEDEPGQEFVLASRQVQPSQHAGEDRKSTRLNSSHANISYAVFCLKKKKKKKKKITNNRSTKDHANS